MLLLFSCQVMSHSPRPPGLQHTKLPYPLPSPGVCINSFPLNQWCHLTISSSLPLFSFCLQSFPAPGSFPTSWLLCIKWPKDWSFSFSTSPSNEYSRLISFRIDWFDLPAVQETQESSLAPQFKSINSWCSVFFFLVQFLHPYVTTGKTIASTTQTSGFFRFSFLR